MRKLTEKEFKEAIMAKMPRADLKKWRKEYYKKERDETPRQFYLRVKYALNDKTAPSP